MKFGGQDGRRSEGYILKKKKIAMVVNLFTHDKTRLDLLKSEAVLLLGLILFFFFVRSSS